MRTSTPLATAILSLALLVIGCTKPHDPKPTKQCLDCPGDGHSTLSAELLIHMAENYRNTQHRYIVTNNQRPLNDQWPYANDAQSIWFSIDSIKNFICQIEAQTPGTPTNKLGIRFYYAAYPQSADFSKYTDLKELPTSYAQRHTLFMIPTMLFNNVHSDFDPFIPATWPTGRHDMKVFLQNNRQARITVGRPKTKNGTINDPTAKNHGDLIPPPNSEHEGAY